MTTGTLSKNVYQNQSQGYVSVIGEIFLLWLKCTIEFFIAFYRLLCPVEEKSVKGEIVLVTGAGHGIGRELALQFAALGATVVCWDINKKNNEQTVKDINEISYPKAYSYVCDVSNRQQVLEVAQKVKSEVGDVTILVNNAGIMPCHAFQDHTEEEIRKIFDINVLAHFWMLEAFLPSMMQKNHGHVVSLSSMAGVLGLRNLVPYCASKFAVRGLTEALSEEIRETTANSNLHFTAIYPYMVDTGLCKNPRFRFESLFNMLPPKQVAKEIISATRKNVKEMSIPSIFFNLNNYFRLMPHNVSLLVKDYLDSGVDAD